MCANFLIRPANREDAWAMARVRVDTWRAAYRGLVPDDVLEGLSYQDTEQRWIHNLWEANQGGRAYVAVSSAGEVVGIAFCGPVRETPDDTYLGEVYVLYVLPAFQGQGVGRALMSACVHDLEQRGLLPFILWTFAEGPARSFYEALGGRVVGEQELEIGGKRLKEVCYAWLNQPAFQKQIPTS